MCDKGKPGKYFKSNDLNEISLNAGGMADFLMLRINNLRVSACQLAVQEIECENEREKWNK